MSRDSITQKTLKKFMEYNPITGVFTWIYSDNNRIKIGAEAGYIKPDGYVVIKFRGKNYPAHRLAFLYMTGSLPLHEVDHIDHVRSNNKWSNLREATHSANGKNQSMYSTNKSGTVGVCKVKSTGSWVATITVNRRFIRLGTFRNKEDAIKARKDAENKYSFHENHGK